MTIPILIDCDPGQDDALALLAAWGSPELAVAAVTTVGGNATARQGAGNALGLAAFAGAGTAVAVGRDRDDAFRAMPRSIVHGPTGIEGMTLPAAAAAPDPRPAVEVILAALRATPGLTICALGPLTNIAAALAADRRAFDRLGRLIVMGGSTGRGNRTPAAEFNVWVDPEAAAAVLAAGLPVTLVGLNLTYEVLAPEGLEERLAALPNAAGPAAAGILAVFGRRYRAFRGLPRPAVHDLLVVAEAAMPGIVVTVDANVVVETDGTYTRGATVVDLHRVTGRPANAAVAVDIDRERLWSWFEAAVARLP